MTVSLSSHAWEAMGFRRIAEAAPIVAKFYSAHIYQVEGILLPDDTAVLTRSGQVHGTAYAMALGSSVNELSRAVSVDEFTDDEHAWATEHKCKAPYVLIHFGPSNEHSCGSGYVKDEGSTLATGDCFSEARTEMRVSEFNALPSLISALICRFGSAEHPVRFRPIDKRFFGFTANNRILHDLRFGATATGYSSARITEDAARTALENATVFAARINPKVSRVFQLAHEESDPLKRFLFFFLSIEIETHSVFAAIDHSMHIANMLKCPDRLRDSSSTFLQSQREKWTTLKDRFVWCALCAWTHLTDTDVEQFTRLKKVRDDIAHGRIVTPPAESVVAVALLATSLHRIGTGV